MFFGLVRLILPIRSGHSRLNSSWQKFQSSRAAIETPVPFFRYTLPKHCIHLPSSHHITLFILGGTNVKMSGPCFTANDNIVVQLDNDVNINATFSEELTSSVTILVLNKTWRLSFRYLVIKVYTSGIHIRYFINYSLSNCLLSSLLSSVKSVNLRKN